MKFKNVFFILVIILGITIYKGYWKQREVYLKNMSWPLQLACNKIIQDAYGRHATDIHTKNVGYHDAHITSSYFSIFNELRYLKIRSSAQIYFNDFAPQDLYCVATIDPGKNIINKNTEVVFLFHLPKHLPNDNQNDRYYIGDKKITLEQIEELMPFKFSSFYRNPIEKPSLLESMFSSFDKE